jgi:hypothetical protein
MNKIVAASKIETEKDFLEFIAPIGFRVQESAIEGFLG